jgi:IS4 transposase
MASLASTLRRIKSDPLNCLGGGDRVNEIFAKVGHVWRNCTFNPAHTMKLFILQVLHGNTAMSHLRDLTGEDVKDATYCEARMKLPVEGVAAAIESMHSECSECSETSRHWLGHRVLIADATSASAPDEPVLQDLWPQPSAQKSGCGFPLIKLLGMLDLVTGLIVQFSMMSMGVHEMSQLPGLHAMLKAGDVLLADRGFCSFWHLAMLAQSSVNAVFRAHQKQIIDFAPNRPHRRQKGKKHQRGRKGMPTSRYVRRLGHQDQLVEWVRPAKKPDWMSDEQWEKMPDTLLIRELRYHIVAKGRRTRVVTIVTTLTDATLYSKREVAKLYGLRWEIETNFRHLKTTMKMDQLKCRTVEGAIKELMIFVLVYNAVRAAMVLAADHQGVDANRISFIGALRRLRSIFHAPAIHGPIDLKVNPVRPGRYCPRVIKRRIKPYDLMNRPRNEYVEPAPEKEVTP